MNLKETAQEIREALEDRRKEIDLTFTENKHIYKMKDIDGKKKQNFPSVSKILKNFFKPFDANAKSLEMCKGDLEKQKVLLNEWKMLGEYSTNMGSRVHYLLESELIKQYNNFKTVRKPVFSCDDSQIKKGDAMIIAGKKYIELMHERGAVLLDTESVLGDPELGYVGQPDKSWLILNKEKDGFGLVITDWKTSQKKNFEVQPYTDKMYHPFENYYNTSLTHFFIQIPLYGRLLIKMLKNSKFKDIKLLGGVVVHLREDASFYEYRVPKEITETILQINLKQYVK